MASNDRYKDIFIGERGYGDGAAKNTIALDQAGTYQFAPHISNYGGNTPYARRNVQGYLIEAPQFFRFMKDGDLLVRCLKALVEVHARTITGLNRTKTVDTAAAAWGGSGENIDTPTNVTRAVSTPTFGMFELQGRAVTKFIDTWITYGIGDENTKVPLVVSQGNVAPEDYDARFYSATMLFVEWDPTGQDVVSAWLCTNMFPKGTPNWEGSKDAGQMAQYEDITVEFTALSDVSLSTENLARKLVRELNVAGMNPNRTANAFTGISADVLAAEVGLKKQLEEGAASRIEYE